MTRKEQIIEAGIEYTMQNNPVLYLLDIGTATMISSLTVVNTVILGLLMSVLLILDMFGVSVVTVSEAVVSTVTEPVLMVSLYVGYLRNNGSEN